MATALKEITSDLLKAEPTSPSQTLSHLSLLLGPSLFSLHFTGLSHRISVPISLHYLFLYPLLEPSRKCQCSPSSCNWPIFWINTSSKDDFIPRLQLSPLWVWLHKQIFIFSLLVLNPRPVFLDFFFFAGGGSCGKVFCFVHLFVLNLEHFVVPESEEVLKWTNK